MNDDIDFSKIQKVSMRDFYKNMKKYQGLVAAGGTFVVTKNKRPVFTVSAPVAEVEKKKYTLADFKTIKFKSGEKNLSQKIDQILYS